MDQSGHLKLQRQDCHEEHSTALVHFLAGFVEHDEQHVQQLAYAAYCGTLEEQSRPYLEHERYH
jgi:hypothetical protein